MKAENTRTLTVFRERLKRLPISRHPALFFSPGVEGYRAYAFGGRAGPVIQVSSMFHEMGHAAQFGPEMFRTRATDRGFHFKVPTRYIYDRYCAEPRTHQATLRELDTFAYQLHLLRMAGYKVDDRVFADYSARLMQYMHDWWHVPGADQDARAEYCAGHILEVYARLTPALVLDRLEAWLDATARRLKRLKQVYPLPWEDQCNVQRYRVDGTVWTC